MTALEKILELLFRKIIPSQMLMADHVCYILLSIVPFLVTAKVLPASERRALQLFVQRRCRIRCITECFRVLDLPEGKRTNIRYLPTNTTEQT